MTNLLKNTKVDGLEVNLKKLDSKNDIADFISTIKTKLGSDLYVALSVPPKTEALAKYFDFKALSKYVDLFVLQTAFLGASKNVTFHPSRLSGLWDMQNTVSRVFSAICVNVIPKTPTVYITSSFTSRAIIFSYEGFTVI